MIEWNGKSVELKDVSAIDLEGETRDGTWAIVDHYDGEHRAKQHYQRDESEGAKCRRYLLARTGADDQYAKVAKERDDYSKKWSTEYHRAQGLERDLKEVRDRLFELQRAYAEAMEAKADGSDSDE